VAVGGLLPGDHPGAHRGGPAGPVDFLRGLKENVIIGKLIPAGTGADTYQAVQPLLPGAAAVSALSLFGGPAPRSEEEPLPDNPAEWLARLGANKDAEELAGEAAGAVRTTGGDENGEGSEE